MNQRLLTRLLGIGALCGIAALGWQSFSVFGNAEPQSVAVGAAHSGVIRGQFTLSNSPEVTVFAMSVKGGLAMGSTSYRLTGDGTLVRSSGSNAKRDEVRSLGFIEMNDLMKIAVDGGLVGLDWEELEAKIIRQRGHVPSLTDTPRLTLEFQLDSHDGQREGEGSVSSRFTCVCIPAYLNRYLPEIPEVAALHALTSKLQELFRAEELDP